MTKKRLLSLLLTAVLIIFGGYYYINHREEFQLISDVSGGSIAILMGLEGLMILGLGLQMKILTDHYELRLTFLQCFRLARMTSLVNFMFGFAAGASVKAVYLKRFHDLRYGSFIAATGIAALIKLMVGGVFATVLLLTLEQTITIPLLVAGAIAISTLLFFALADRVPQVVVSFWQVVSDLVREWRLIRHDRRMMLRLLCLSTLLFVIYSLEVVFAFAAFGIHAPLSITGVITAFENLAGVVKLIPGNVGLKEAIFGMIAVTYEIGINQAVHAAVLHRLIRVTVSLLVGSGFAYRLMRTERQQQIDKFEIDAIASRIVG